MINFLWDGEKVVLLDYEIDDYGSVSKEFPFPEFRPEYFSESIVHNNIVRLTPEKIEEAIRNFNIDTQTSFVTDRYNKYPIKIYTMVDNIDIKYNKMILKADYLNYDRENGTFIVNIPIYAVEYSDYKRFVKNADYTFTPEWKATIISVASTSSKTTYFWKEDSLKVITVLK